ncbi:RNA-binding protein [Taenia solium]|eukprot:TsM_000869400 transcript=TsM_000869400 gene=TsM_000869400
MKARVKLYVGELRPNHMERQLRQHFAQCGAITECFVALSFVTFWEEAQATRALIDCLNFELNKKGEKVAIFSCVV